MSSKKGKQPMTTAPYIDAAISTDEQWNITIVFANLGERNEFAVAYKAYIGDLNAAPLYPFMKRYIKQWPYDGLNPAKESDYNLLTTEQWDEGVMLHLTKALEAFRK